MAELAARRTETLSQIHGRIDWGSWGCQRGIRNLTRICSERDRSTGGRRRLHGASFLVGSDTG